MIGFLFLLLISAVGIAEESDVPPEPQIVVSLGAGRATVQAQGLELSEETLQILQTELLVDDKLSRAVMSEQITRLSLTGRDVQNMKTESHQLAVKTAQNIQLMVAQEIAPESVPAVDGNSVKTSGGFAENWIERLRKWLRRE